MFVKFLENQKKSNLLRFHSTNSLHKEYVFKYRDFLKQALESSEVISNIFSKKPKKVKAKTFITKENQIPNLNENDSRFNHPSSTKEIIYIN